MPGERHAVEHPDRHLGEGYASWVLDLGSDDEGPVVATLIHRQDTDVVPDPDPAGPMPALYLHGWSDYVFQVHVLEHLADRGFDVWAMDLRKHGRSLREGQTPTAIADLEDYDSELDAALAAMGGRAPLVIAHSTGGLVAALYAARHPGRFSGLVLNSPWLAFHGHPSLGKALERPVHAIASRRPFVQVMPRGADHYARTIHSDYGGDFTYDLELKPIGGHPFPAATFGAVLAGQAALTVADPISEPVLVLRAARSYFGRLLSERMSRSDVVLDVRAIARAALRLGEDVEDAPIEDARHDVFLSDPAVIDEVFAVLGAWLREKGLNPRADEPRGAEDSVGSDVEPDPGSTVGSDASMGQDEENSAPSP